MLPPLNRLRFVPFSFQRMGSKPTQYTSEVEIRAVANALECFDRYKSVYATYADMALKLNVGKETLW